MMNTNHENYFCAKDGHLMIENNKQFLKPILTTFFFFGTEKEIRWIVFISNAEN